MEPNESQQPIPTEPAAPQQPPQQQQPPHQPDAEWPGIAPPEPTQAPTVFRDYLAAQGHDVSAYESDEPLLRDVAAAHDAAQRAPSQEQIRQFEQLQPLVQEYAQEAGEYRKWKESQHPAVPETPEPAKEAPKWGAPAISDHTSNWIDQGMIGRTEDGKLGVINAMTQKFEYDPRYAAELREAEKWLSWQTTANRRLAQDPAGAVWDAGLEDRLSDYLTREEVQGKLADAAAQRALTIMQQQQQQTSQQGLADRQRSFVQEHRGEFFTPANQLTEKGEAYEQAYTEARHLFYGNKEQLSAEEEHAAFRYAVGLSLGVDPDAPQLTPPPEQPAQQAREEKQQTFLGKARERNGRQKPVNRLVADERPPSTVATEAARESARDDLDDDSAWDEAQREAAQDLV